MLIGRLFVVRRRQLTKGYIYDIALVFAPLRPLQGTVLRWQRMIDQVTMTNVQVGNARICSAELNEHQNTMPFTVSRPVHTLPRDYVQACHNAHQILFRHIDTLYTSQPRHSIITASSAASTPTASPPLRAPPPAAAPPQSPPQ